MPGGSGVADNRAAVTVAPFISQIAIVPSLFRHRMSSEKPSPVKSSAPIAVHAVPGLPMTGAAIGVAPFISQIATVPSLFCHRMSEWPSRLKSPAPTAFHDVPGLPMTGVAI